MRLATLGTLGATLFLAPAALAQTAQPLPFSQDWSNVGLITVNGDWSAVPGVVGYIGSGVTAAAALPDPRTVVADLSGTPLAVTANQQTAPSAAGSGGIYEFELPNPTVAFQGSGTADAPNLVIRVVTTGMQNIRVRYALRDLDDAADDVTQAVALQYRVGMTGDYANVDAGFVADASTGPNLATLVTPVDATLPAAANNQASVDIRIITSNAVGSDEMTGVDDIQITGSVLSAGGETPDGALTLAVANPVRGTAQVRFSTETAQEARLALYDVLGRRVALLADGTVAGAQTATLDTAGLAPGVYVLRLTAGAGALAQTITVVR